MSDFMKVGVVLDGKAGVFGAKHVGVWHRPSNLVAELTNKKGSDNIYIETKNFDLFRTDKDGQKKEVTQENTANPQQPDDKINSVWDDIINAWNAGKLKHLVYEVVPGKDQFNCESFAEEILTGINSTPQADKVRGTIFEDIANAARSVSQSSQSGSSQYGG